MHLEPPPFWVDLASGSIGGAAQVLTSQPFDIIKVRLQIQDPKAPRYTGMLDCFNQIRREEGILSFYKGTFAPLLAWGVLSTNRFVIFQAIQRYTSYEDSEHQEFTNSLPEFYLSGALAGALTTIFATPVEHARIRVQKQCLRSVQLYSGSFDAAGKIYNEFGIRGLYKGFLATCIKDGIFYGNFFFFFELISRFMRGKELERKLSSMEILLAGGVTGILNWIFVFPFDSLKSIHQTDSLHNPVYKNYRHIIKHKYTTSGLMSLYRGFSISLLRAVPVNATTFYAFESSKAIFTNYSRGEKQK